MTLVLVAMGEAAATTKASLQDLRATTEGSIHELRASLDLLHGNVARIDTTQQQLLEQMGLDSAAVENSGKAYLSWATTQIGLRGTNIMGLGIHTLVTYSSGWSLPSSSPSAASASQVHLFNMYASSS
jgi:hypothetical protein